jgi:hypothetical protein
MASEICTTSDSVARIPSLKQFKLLTILTLERAALFNRIERDLYLEML